MSEDMGTGMSARLAAEMLRDPLLALMGVEIQKQIDEDRAKMQFRMAVLLGSIAGSSATKFGSVYECGRPYPVAAQRWLSALWRYGSGKSYVPNMVIEDRMRNVMRIREPKPSRERRQVKQQMILAVPYVDIEAALRNSQPGTQQCADLSTLSNVCAQTDTNWLRTQAIGLEVAFEYRSVRLGSSKANQVVQAHNFLELSATWRNNEVHALFRWKDAPPSSTKTVRANLTFCTVPLSTISFSTLAREASL